MEDIAGLHSATVGLGLNEISETGCAWVVLNWQMQIIKRPAYNDELTAYTWSTSTISCLQKEISELLTRMVIQLLLPHHAGFIWILTGEDQ